MFSSLVLECMTYACGLLVMIYHWHEGFPGLIMNFPSLSIFGISVALWVHLFLFLVGSHVSLAWVELLVPGALIGQTLWSPLTVWVELLVSYPW